MGRSPCCAKEGLNRGAWTALEDKMLTDYVRANGEGSWRNLPNKAGLKRCGKSCRLRWLNYLRPDIKRGNISPDEEDLIIRLHNLLGNKWSLIAGRLPGRSDNEIKNYWNTNLCKKVAERNNPQPLQLTKKKPGNSASPQLGKTTKVIRTKAVRCTSQVFAKSQPQDFRQVSERSGPSGDSCLVGEVNFDIGGPDTTSDFLLDDFDLAELCLSNADFSDVGLQGILEDIDNDLSSSVDDIAFSDTMLPEWASPAGDSDPDNALPNLFSISSFLDTEEEFVPNTN